MSFALLVALIGFAVNDFVSVAKQRERRTQEAVLASELANFLLAVRDDSGSSLLENPAQFSSAVRPLTVLTLRKPFFGYFLRRANAATVKAEQLDWQPPAQCVVEFAPTSQNAVATGAAFQACFADVENDPAGRYVYFALRYPRSSRLVRHERGLPLSSADSIRLQFRGARSVFVTLVFEVPPLAKSRYPSQLARFSGIHEITGYQSDGQVARWIDGQAFERQAPSAKGDEGIVTILGRMDSAALLALPAGTEVEPRADLKALRIGMSIQGPAMSRPDLTVEPGTAGAALVSLEQAYLQRVESKSRLEVLSSGKTRQVLWTSDALTSPRELSDTSLFQRISDTWTSWLITLLAADDPVPLHTSRQVPGAPGMEATITTIPLRVPDLASRLFLILSAAVVVVLFFSVVYFKAISRLGRLADAAYRVASHPTVGGLEGFKKNDTEIGTFTRILDILIRRSRARNKRIVFRAANVMRVVQEQVKARHAVLETLGHEIRSPLQSLINQAKEKAQVPSELVRMHRAVEALYDATSLINAVENGKFVLEVGDIASYLREYAQNVSALKETPVRYEGTPLEASAVFDPVWFEQVLDNLVANADRYRRSSSDIVVSLQLLPASVRIEVFNQGEGVAADELEAIFEYGNSTMDTPENRGIGLFMARLYMVAMRGSIRAENRSDGVAMVMELQAPWRNVPHQLAPDEITAPSNS